MAAIDKPAVLMVAGRSVVTEAISSVWIGWYRFCLKVVLLEGNESDCSIPLSINSLGCCVPEGVGDFCALEGQDPGAIN